MHGKDAVLPSKTPVKRLFSDTLKSGHSDAGVEQQFEDAENAYDANPENQTPDSARKRHKNREWPLPPNKHDAPARAPLRPRAGGPNSPKYPRRASSIQPSLQPPRPHMHQRSSSFIEGSMNDRVSMPPPVNYIEHEDLMDRFDAEKQNSEKGFERTDSGDFISRQDGSAAMPQTAVKAEKPSTMVRFGKNMVSVFNVANWKLFSRSSKDSKSENLNGRNYDIEASQQAYQELKASGSFQEHATHSTRFPRPQNMVPNSVKPAVPRYHLNVADAPLEKDNLGAVFPPRESTTSVQEYSQPETPQKEKRYGRVYSTSPVRQSRAPSPSSVSQSSRASFDNSPRKRRSSFTFKKPNFARYSVSSSDLPLSNPQTVRKMPSKKQLAHEQKLVKKISNLESQLEQARRQLSESVGEPLVLTTMETLSKKLNERPPVEFTAEPIKNTRRRNFVPGALSTLPSERLLIAEEESFNDSYGDGINFLSPAFEDNKKNAFLQPNHAQVTARNIPQGIQASSHILKATADEFRDDERSGFDASSVHDSEITGDTVIHHHLSSDSVNHSQEVVAMNVHDTVKKATTPVRPKQPGGGDAKGFKIYDDSAETINLDKQLPGVTESDGNVNLNTPKAKPVMRKTSTKRKSYGNEDDDDVYKPSRSEESDDDAAWDEAARLSTPRKSVSRQSLKKQKTSTTESPKDRVRKQASFDSPKERIKKQASFDSPKGPFISSTKQPKRASVPISTPPKQRASPLNEIKRKSLSHLPPPPSSSFSFTSGHHQQRPGTPIASKSQSAAQKRPTSPVGFASSILKKSVPNLRVSEDVFGSQEEDFIPPVPKLSEEVLKKHKEAAKARQKRLTVDDIHRHKKAASNAGSTHPDQDVPMKSIERDTTKSTSSHGTSRVKEVKKENKDDFEWDDDVF